MNTEPRTEVQVSHHFNVPAERLYDAWLDPQTVGRWLFATSTGKMTRVEIDPRVDGGFNITEKREEEEIEHLGKYLVLERPKHIVFEFTVPKFSKEATRVNIEITPAKSGCDLKLTHRGILPDYADRTKEGWTTILKNLEALPS